MRLYWTSKSIPEMEGLDKARRKLAWSYAYRKSLLHWQTYVALILCGVCSAMPAFFGYRELVFTAIGGGVAGLIFGQVSTHISRQYITEWKTKVENWKNTSCVTEIPPTNY